MDGFCLHYLLLILVMRSGDIETNPGPNPAVSTVSEMEFLKLAQDIDPSYYYNVGISLGFSHAQLRAILIGNLMNFKDAFMDVFMKWNIKQQPPHSNKRQLLADKLREIDLGCLSDGLLNGPPIPNSLDRNEFTRLIEEVVLPRKEEFRYLLYFTVSQNKSIATHIMNSMLQGLPVSSLNYMQKKIIVDVAFESQDSDVAALVKNRVSSEEIELRISENMTAHTVAGFAFVGPHVVELCIQRDCGPTMSLDVAEMICSMPSLKKVFLIDAACHHCFFETLASKGKESKVQTLLINRLQCATPASSHHLAEALCSMPNLTDLSLTGVHPTEEFYSTLKAKASSIQGCFPQIRKGNFRFNGAPQDDLNSFLHSLPCYQRSVQYTCM
eukprot:XP_011668653.1 PREDICTED: uncharacterized protein LOC105440341 [Strongylocentrotus purpuratus]